MVSLDGDQGFPGKLVIEALVALIGAKKPDHKEKAGDADVEYNLGSIVLAYRAKLREGDKQVVTPINLTQVRFGSWPRKYDRDFFRS